jgi:trehalose 6-phosphate synthase/phosphatase
MSSAGRLVVVSNRLPLTLRRSGEEWKAERSAGGLVTALDPLFESGEGLWIGWPGEAPPSPDPERQAMLERWEAQHHFASVDLPREVVRGFYGGYSNQTLWPLFHGFPTLMEFNPASWHQYVEANERFRDAVVARLQPGDRVWVHDYHLMLLPRLLRDAAPDAAIGFFLHIPFPAAEQFRVLPRRKELLEGLLGADFIAFQTHSHLQQFRNSLLRLLGIESRFDRVEIEGRMARLEALPIGIVPETFTDLLEGDERVQRSQGELARRHAGRRLLLAVDRLDYTKGIPERLRAYRSLLENNPDLRGKVVLMQIAVPSRERLGRYRELRRQVNELVGEINGQYATPDWTPLVYIRRGISRAELVALYSSAAVGWVTPLRDGMNLVAKEYVACQRGGEGILLLSEFAGAAAEMGEAFIVNPYDEESTAEVLQRALTLPPEERRSRMEALYRRVRRNDAGAWSRRFLEGLDAAHRHRGRELSQTLPLLPRDEVLAAAQAAGERLLLLDYDGTLVRFESQPGDAAPTAELRRMLAELAARPGNRVVIVTGRPSVTLEKWFDGIAGLWLAAEEGALLRAPGRDHWEPLHPTRASHWKSRVLPILEHYVDRTPGSFIEEREYSLVWHHRMSDPVVGPWLANELLATLAEALADTDLTAVGGRKLVEVRHVWVSKVEVVGRIEASGAEPDFRLAIGDDRTDEVLFARLPDDAWTIHVGDGPSRARFRLPGPGEVRQFLAALAHI